MKRLARLLLLGIGLAGILGGVPFRERGNSGSQGFGGGAGIVLGGSLSVPAADAGLTITPSSGFNTNHAAATELSANIWAFIPTGERDNRDALIGRGRRLAGQGGWALSSHFSAGGANGHMWFEFSLTGSDMGSSRYATFNYANLLEENGWHMYTVVYDPSETGNARIKVYKDASPNDATSITASMPANLSTMTNLDIEIGRKQGFYYHDANTGDGRRFREASVFLRALTQEEVTALYNSGFAAVPVDAAMYVPLGDGIAEANGMSTALVGGASSVSETESPFAP